MKISPQRQHFLVSNTNIYFSYLNVSSLFLQSVEPSRVLRKFFLVSQYIIPPQFIVPLTQLSHSMAMGEFSGYSLFNLQIYSELLPFDGRSEKINTKNF